jgi:hypothetical protein
MGLNHLRVLDTHQYILEKFIAELGRGKPRADTQIRNQPEHVSLIYRDSVEHLLDMLKIQNFLHHRIVKTEVRHNRANYPINLIFFFEFISLEDLKNESQHFLLV